MTLTSTNPEIPWAKPAISDFLAIRKLRTSAEAKLLLGCIKSASENFSGQTLVDAFLRVYINNAFAIYI